MPEELPVEDKKFIINLTLSNRQFLITLHTLMLSFAVALTSFVIALYTLLIALRPANKVIYGIVCFAFLIGIWTHWYILHRKTWPSLKNTNEQYQKYFFELYPSLKDTKFYH